MQLHKDWKKIAKGAWSARLAWGSAAFWSALAMVAVLWPALIGHIPLWLLFGGGVLIGGAIGIARLTKQPGLSDAD
jgi:hypothetical protein